MRIAGTITGFSVQYEIFYNEEWFPLVRYDSWHGFSHRDLYHKNGSITKTPMFINNLNDALTFAEEDLKTNIVKYKESFFKGE